MCEEYNALKATKNGIHMLQTNNIYNVMLLPIIQQNPAIFIQQSPNCNIDNINSINNNKNKKQKQNQQTLNSRLQLITIKMNENTINKHNAEIMDCEEIFRS